MKKIIVFVLLVASVAISCQDKKSTAAKSDEYYTCSMHPQVVQDHPGTCPICHMDLIVVKKATTAADEISLNDEQIRLGNIRVDTIRDGVLGDKVLVTATLTADETRSNSINARVTGRIDHLYYRNVGDYVPKGAHLYDLYSEELNTAKQEYIAAIERKEQLDSSIIDFGRLVESAKTKLLLWGMSEAQVRELARTKKASPLTAFYSSAAGFITELPVIEGQYVMEGGTVVKLADLSTLWAEAQVYESQLSTIEAGSRATVSLPDLEGKQFTGKISFVNPELSAGTRLNLVRVNIPNGNGQLKPGMPAYISFQTKNRSTLSLPVDAVIRDGKMNTVWVQTAKHTFRAKMVQTGMESGDRIEIKFGLDEGDVVVTSGAYLVNSEYIFKKGAGAMAGHDMSKM